MRWYHWWCFAVLTAASLAGCALPRPAADNEEKPRVYVPPSESYGAD
jgi:hypothetical protein